MVNADESGDMDRFPQGAEILFSPMVILRGTEPLSALTRALYIPALSIFFLFSNFVSGDLALTGF